MTSARAFLDAWEARGVAFRVSGGLVRWRPRAALPDAALAQLRALKPELLALLGERLASEALDRYHERQAIAEVDGGLDPRRAEALARAELLEILPFDPEELGILQPERWQAADLARVAQLKAMSGGQVVHLPGEPEALADSRPIRRA